MFYNILKKFGQFKKIYYLCSVKATGYINIILIITCAILTKLVIIRVLLRLVGLG